MNDETTKAGQALITADQPHLSFGNAFDHPGSTYAGIAAGLGVIAAYTQNNGMPTTALGWLMWSAGLILALGGVLGK